jgi:MADS-box transcription enhancer factor 2A
LQALNKKEHKGAMSPESPEPDAQEYNLTPRTEAKYAKIDEDFQMLIRNQHNGSRVSLVDIFLPPGRPSHNQSPLSF